MKKYRQYIHIYQAIESKSKFTHNIEKCILVNHSFHITNGFMTIANYCHSPAISKAEACLNLLFLYIIVKPVFVFCHVFCDMLMSTSYIISLFISLEAEFYCSYLQGSKINTTLTNNFSGPNV